MQIQVSELIVRYMERLGIDAIFGMPGAHILPVYDSLYDSSIRSILAKHEQGAAFMAGGYARASGKIGACITTAGPGATNLVTGIANAYADKQPILAITGEAPTYIFGKGGLQESSGEGGSIDQSTLFKGITSYSKVIERTDYLPNILNQASKILLSENCAGPVLLSIPFNVQKEMVDEDILDSIKTDNRNYVNTDSSLPVDSMVQMIEQSDHPVIVSGYGAIKSGAQSLVAELSERMNIPVTTSLKGKGVISEQSDLSLGSLGVTSTGYAYRYIIEHADLIVFLGAGFNERTSYLWNDELLKDKKIIQVDNNSQQLEKVFKADIAVNADIKGVLRGVLDTISEPARKTELATSNRERQSWEKSSSIFRSDFSLIESFFEHLESHFDEDIMLFDDNIIFAQNFFHASDRMHYYPNSGVSSLGHAIPAAIGARLTKPFPTFAVLGDGGFQMCCMEIMTAVNYQLPITIILINNSTMGLIRKNQYQQYQQRYIDCDFINPDFEALSRSFGMNYYHVQNESDLDGLFDNMNFKQGINLIDITIDKDTFPTYVSKR